MRESKSLNISRTAKRARYEDYTVLVEEDSRPRLKTNLFVFAAPCGNEIFGFFNLTNLYF
ncbi:MAG: hypothetical protein A2928_04755 [Candidatus Taylorbacteria bacterium RIFCSPLOWO2_01_FULL_45_15b]|uniref:Uncharacterized protein n=1 Tax=Candidatus Taylorbacteria bacterium RIFCSPLOWO2_01_FULL_45_15b TaxID=1802319 RepID=A0A1G2NDR4_9BACT|nr:MAG: hypothetical protein A2928_04755 [Candidatus Taylorbacteria bacterium RIFCSPLOWO2_01_FULL_45_15b]